MPGPDVEGGVPLVRVGDIETGHVAGTGMKRIHRRVADQFQRTYLRGGELLLTLVGTIGRTAVVPESLRGANVARAVGVLPLSWVVSAHWLELYFRSPKQRTRMVGAAHEVARKTLNLEDVRRAVVALPPRHEQERIVDQVADIESVCDAVDRTVTAQLTRCYRLRQSILKWAFEGKLVDQDPTDEPASVLLERIRAERVRDPARLGRKPRGRASRPRGLPCPES